MTKNQKSLLRICVVAVLYVTAILLNALLQLHFHLQMTIFVAIYLAIGYDVLLKAVTNTLRGNLFDENFLMTVATVGAFFIGEQIDAVAVMLLYQIGELFQHYAVGKSRKSIANMLDIRPESATAIVDGAEVQVHPSQIAVGSLFVVKAGDKIPLDGVVVEGNCHVDTSAITGESLPKRFCAGQQITSGCILLDGRLIVEATSDYDNSTVAKILDLVENATSQKANTEKFITKFSKYYTPIVVVFALLLGIVPPLFDGAWSIWLKRAMMFLFVSCPCALVISVPMGFFGGIAAASKKGVLIKGSNYLEKLAQIDTVAFDKTGTLTKGNFVVVEVVPQQNREEILQLASICEQYSNHPIAKAILHQCTPKGNATVKEIAGKGLVAQYEGATLLCGNAKLMSDYNIATPQTSGTTVFVAKDGNYLGYVVIADQLKQTAIQAVSQLKSIKCKTVMLTGDNHQVAQQVARQVGVDGYFANLLPQDKVTQLELLQKQGKVAFVGDGLNDAPVLAHADVGIAMGMGSDVAIQSADVVLMEDNPTAVVTAKKVAKKTMKIVKQNVIFSLLVKFAVLVVSALGLLDNVAFGLIIAILADVGVCVIAILNSMRAMIVKK